jgi:hypothetical protein
MRYDDGGLAGQREDTRAGQQHPDVADHGTGTVVHG